MIIILIGLCTIFFQQLPNYKTKETPKRYRDWLDLIYESIHNPENPNINIKNSGIKKVAEIIDMEILTPTERRLLKEAEGKKVVLRNERELGIIEGIEQGKQEGIIEGIEQGIEKGIEKGKIEIVKNGNKEGLSNMIISKINWFKHNRNRRNIKK